MPKPAILEALRVGFTDGLNGGNASGDAVANGRKPVTIIRVSPESGSGSEERPKHHRDGKGKKSSSSSSSSEEEKHGPRRGGKEMGGSLESGGSSEEPNVMHASRPHPRPKPRPHPRPPPAKQINFIKNLDVKVVKTGPITIEHSKIHIGAPPHKPSVGGVHPFGPRAFGLAPSPFPFHHRPFLPPPPIPPMHKQPYTGMSHSPPVWSKDNGLVLMLHVRPCTALVVLIIVALVIAYKLARRACRGKKDSGSSNCCLKHDGGEKSSTCSTCYDGTISEKKPKS